MKTTIETIGESRDDNGSAPAASPDPHMPLCTASRCVIDCPHYLESLSDGELMALLRARGMAGEVEHVASAASRFLDDEGRDGEDLIQKAARIFKLW